MIIIMIIINTVIIIIIIIILFVGCLCHKVITKTRLFKYTWQKN